MAGRITELFGYRVDDRSEAAIAAAEGVNCPFIGGRCTKSIRLDGKTIVSGVCAVQQKSSEAPEVICCPNRLYANDYQMLRDIALIAFGSDLELVLPHDAISKAEASGNSVVAVFGLRWGRELRLPQKQIQRSFFVDWVLAKVSAAGDLEDFCAVEVQTIDTTGNYRESRRALTPPRREIAWSTVGLNWENVNKRILPQLIYKSQVLAREELCQKGMFFVVPMPVYETIMVRLGGETEVRTVGRLQPSSITFLAYDFDSEAQDRDGEIRPLRIVKQRKTMISDVIEAFNRVRLPEQNVYGQAISEALHKG